MSSIPEAFVTTGCNCHRRRYVKDQGHGAAMKHATHVAQLPGHGEAEDRTCVVRIGAGRMMRDRLKLEYFRQDGIMALSKTVRATTWDTQQSTCIVFARFRHLKLTLAVSANAIDRALYRPMFEPFPSATGHPQQAPMHVFA
jgi:hypothetical protein